MREVSEKKKFSKWKVVLAFVFVIAIMSLTLFLMLNREKPQEVSLEIEEPPITEQQTQVETEGTKEATGGTEEKIQEETEEEVIEENEDVETEDETINAVEESVSSSITIEEEQQTSSISMEEKTQNSASEVKTEKKQSEESKEAKKTEEKPKKEEVKEQPEPQHQKEIEKPKIEEKPKEEKPKEVSPQEVDGVMVKGVRIFDDDIDYTTNKYLTTFMETHCPKSDYHIFLAGMKYSRFGDVLDGTGNSSLGFGPNKYKGYWEIEINSFVEGKLKTLTGDAEAVYNKLVEMYDDPEDLNIEEFKKKHKFGEWKQVGQTSYMFDTTNGNALLLKIKY